MFRPLCDILSSQSNNSLHYQSRADVFKDLTQTALISSWQHLCRQYLSQAVRTYQDSTYLNKTSSNLLGKKNRKMFWKRHTISRRQVWSRDFTTALMSPAPLCRHFSMYSVYLPARSLPDFPKILKILLIASMLISHALSAFLCRGKVATRFSCQLCREEAKSF